MRTPRLAPPILMMLVAACAQAQPLIPAARTQEVVVDMGVANGRTARVAISLPIDPARYQLKAIAHAWVAADITQYDVHLEVATTDHNTYAELASPPLVAHVPIAGNAGTAQAVFEHLSPGKYYRAYVSALGRKDGTAGTGTPVALNTAHALTDSADFDFTTPQDQSPDKSQPVTVHFDNVDFSGTANVGFLTPDNGTYNTHVGPPTIAYSAPPPPTSLVVTPFNVGDSPYGVAVDPNNGHVWVSHSTDIGVVTELSSTGALITSITVEAGLYGLAVDPHNGHVWSVNSAGAGTVSELSSSGDFISNFPVGANPTFVAVDPHNGNVWTPNVVDNTVTELSSTGAFISNIHVGNFPEGIAVDPGNGQVWVVNFKDNTMTELSSTGVFISNIHVGSGPVDVAVDPNNGHLWVASGSNNTVTELSSTGVFISNIHVGSTPQAVAVDPHNGLVWVVNFLGNTVTELSSSGALISNFTVGSGPTSVAVDPNNGHVWVTNQGDGTVSEIH